jgi:hypothetical protein
MQRKIGDAFEEGAQGSVYDLVFGMYADLESSGCSLCTY